MSLVNKSFASPHLWRNEERWRFVATLSPSLSPQITGTRVRERPELWIIPIQFPLQLNCSFASSCFSATYNDVWQCLSCWGFLCLLVVFFFTFQHVTLQFIRKCQFDLWGISGVSWYLWLICCICHPVNPGILSLTFFFFFFFFFNSDFCRMCIYSIKVKQMYLFPHVVNKTRNVLKKAF